ncbi:AraC family transcriptional regulator [Nocardia brasiliensis]
MVVPPNRFGGQSQYVPQRAPQPGQQSGHELIEWAREHLADNLTVTRMARHAGLSHRTLIRRFKATTSLTPQQWLARERLRRACELLETTDLPIDRVAEQCGLGSAANLRFRFHQHLGATPTAYRNTYAATEGRTGRVR